MADNMPRVVDAIGIATLKRIDLCVVPIEVHIGAENGRGAVAASVAYKKCGSMLLRLLQAVN
jgi:hypothetical protein